MTQHANFNETVLSFSSSQNYIVNIASIDAQIIQLAPDLLKYSKKKIRIIANAIITFWFDDTSSINTELLNNENVIEYIYGIKEIIKHEGIKDLNGLENYIHSRIKSFTPGKLLKS